MSFSVFNKKFSIAVFMSMLVLFANTISHQMLSPSLCSNSDWLLTFGQRCCCDIMFLPTNPASVKKAKASSSTDHSLPRCCTSSSWYFFSYFKRTIDAIVKVVLAHTVSIKSAFTLFFVSVSFTLAVGLSDA